MSLSESAQAIANSDKAKIKTEPHLGSPNKAYTGPVEGESAQPHLHACLSAAARLVEAIHASDSHGAHQALADHHEAHRLLLGYKDNADEG